jgi:hypothetical protein
MMYPQRCFRQRVERPHLFDTYSSALILFIVSIVTPVLWGTSLLLHKTLHSLSLLSVLFHLSLLLRVMCSVESVEQTPSCEANIHSDVKEVLCLLCNYQV